MIICPNCKEEIDDDSRYCDQCGQELLFCEKCGRVGIGRRCTSCGGLLVSHDELDNISRQMSLSSSMSQRYNYNSPGFSTTGRGGRMPMDMSLGIPVLMLYNDSLNIRIAGIDGAVIGRRQGPYTQFFQQNMYVSGVHAQLKFDPNRGWCVVDMHSSNGTKLNDRLLMPDIEMSLKSGDILTLANVSLQVTIS